MKYYRVGLNDYVLTASTGPRELLFIKHKKTGALSVIEQQRSKAADDQACKTASFDYSVHKTVPNESMFGQSQDLVKHQATTVDDFETRELTVRRYRYAQGKSVKWAPYRIDGQIFMLPYRIEPPLRTDTRLLQPRSAKKTATKNNKTKEV